MQTVGREMMAGPYPNLHQDRTHFPVLKKCLYLIGVQGPWNYSFLAPHCNLSVATTYPPYFTYLEIHEVPLPKVS